MPNRALVPIALGLGLTLACGRLPGLSNKGSVAARVGSRTISVEEVDESIRPEIARIEGERYEARKAKLDQLIDEALLAQKAKATGVSPEELVQREITEKTKEPTDEDIKATFDKLKAPPGGKSFETLAPRIKELLASQAATARRTEYLAELRKETAVSVKLNPPRFTIDTTTGHADGPEKAPITLIEFSDYQCPFCGRSQETLGKVLAKYEGQIHHVFMDFPLSTIHPAAMSAAVASHCAEEQQKFREYHDLLFEHQRELAAENFKKWAAELGMDAAAFETCLGSKKFDERIQQSVKAGRRAGVSGTPGFFVNGIAIKGAQPFEVFQRTIDDELARAK